LRWLRGRYPWGQVLHVVLDNYSPHLKEEVAIWAFGHNVRFYFTPSQPSWLNRIESPFTALKEFALNHSDFRSHEEQIVAILRHLDWRDRKARPLVDGREGVSTWTCGASLMDRETSPLEAALYCRNLTPNTAYHTYQGFVRDAGKRHRLLEAGAEAARGPPPDPASPTIPLPYGHCT
jgi:hypothetical protein